MKTIFALICFITFNFAHAAENRTLGLLEIPKIFGGANPDGPPGQKPAAAGTAIKLFADANDKSKVVAQISKPEEITSREHGYEESSAVVYAQKPGWYLIEGKGVRGWLATKEAGKFRSLEELLDSGLIYVETGWNKRLYSAPGAKSFEMQSPKDEQPGVSILGKKKIGNELWYQVQFVQGRCEGEETLGKKGWVPAYSDTGAPNLWFYSRGC